MRSVVLMSAYEPDENMIEIVSQLLERNTAVVIVDDGSGWKYRSLFSRAHAMGCDVVTQPLNEGKGAALKTGLRWIMKQYPEVDIVITADCDGRHRSSDILKIRDAALNEPHNDGHLLLGTWDLKAEGMPFHTRIENWFSSIFFRLAAGQSLTDVQTGLRAVPKNLFQTALTTEGSGFDYEMNFLMRCALMQKYAGEIIREVPVITACSGLDNHISDSISMYRVPLKYAGSSLLSALVDLGVFTILLDLNISWMSAACAVVIARILSGIVYFSMNRRWNTSMEKNSSSKAVRFGMIFVIQMILSSLLVTAAETLPFNLTLSKAVIDACLGIAGFIVKRKFIFLKDQSALQQITSRRA